MEAAEAGHWGHHSHNCLDIRPQLLGGYTSFILYCESKRYIALFNVIVNPHQVCLCPKSKENKSFILNSYFIFIWTLIRKKVFLELQWHNKCKIWSKVGQLLDCSLLNKHWCSQFCSPVATFSFSPANPQQQQWQQCLAVSSDWNEVQNLKWLHSNIETCCYTQHNTLSIQK